MAAAPIIPDARVCFAELIVRLDSLLTLREDRVAVEEGEEQDDKIHAELESDIKLKLNELHLRLKNGGAVQDRSIGDDVDEEDEAVDDSQFSYANETGGGKYYRIIHTRKLLRKKRSKSWSSLDFVFSYSRFLIFLKDLA